METPPRTLGQPFDVWTSRRLSDYLTQQTGTRVGSMNLGGAKSGVMDKDRIAFDYEQVAPGVFKVMPRADLGTGEYGFLYSVSAGSGPGMWGGGTGGARIFDFAIRP